MAGLCSWIAMLIWPAGLTYCGSVAVALNGTALAATREEDAPAPHERSHHAGDYRGDWRICFGEPCAVLAPQPAQHAEPLRDPGPAVTVRDDKSGGGTKAGERAGRS